MEHRTKRTKFSDNEESKVKEQMMIEGDKISHLPEPIIHHVMSLLPTRYAVRTSVLSHKWNAFWSTFPVINLTDLDFLDPGDEMENPPEYSGYSDRFIDYLLLTLSHHNLKNLDLFRIYTLIRGHIDHYEVVELLLDEAMRGKLKNLDLKFAHRTHELINGENGEEECEECYKLPPALFLFGQSLLSLKVEGCNFVGFEENLSARFHVLKTLSIIDTHIEEAFLEKVIRGSFDLESLHLKKCHGLKSITFSHCRMKKFVLARCRDLRKCKIDAPGLQSFKYKGYYLLNNENGDVEKSRFKPVTDAFKFLSLKYLFLHRVRMKADKFNKMISSFPMLKFIKTKECEISERSQVLGDGLTNLVIEDCRFEESPECRAGNLEDIKFINSINIFNFSNIFQNLSSISFIRIDELTCSDIQLSVANCPQLSSLVLLSCDGLDGVKIISSTLEYLVISDCVNVKEVRILAPVLIFFKYIGPILKFSRLLTSNKLVAELNVKCDKINHEDLELFQLGDFLQMFSRCAESITLNCHCVECMSMLKISSNSSTMRYLNYFKVATESGVMGLVELLQSMLMVSVRHKTMCLDLENSCAVEMEFREHTRGEEMLDEHDYLRAYNCVQDHLLEVRITNFAGLLDDIRLVRFLICNASSLRKFSITIRDSSALPSETRYCSEVISRIHNLPKASPDAEILVSYS